MPMPMLMTTTPRASNPPVLPTRVLPASGYPCGYPVMLLSFTLIPQSTPWIPRYLLVPATQPTQPLTRATAGARRAPASWPAPASAAWCTPQRSPPPSQSPPSHTPAPDEAPRGHCCQHRAYLTPYCYCCCCHCCCCYCCCCCCYWGRQQRTASQIWLHPPAGGHTPAGSSILLNLQALT